MSMNLELEYNASGEGAQQRINFFERRRYVVREMVPEGYEQYFLDQARYASAHTSTAIEGNPLGEQQAMRVLLYGADVDEPAEIEKENADAAYEMVSLIGSDKNTSNRRRVDPHFQLDLAQEPTRACCGSSGQISPRRKSDRRRGHARGPVQPTAARVGSRSHARLGPEHRTMVQDDPPPVVAAKAHFALISIHPFEDGNGRTARLVADLILEYCGWSIGG